MAKASGPEALVRRFVRDVMAGGDVDLIDELFHEAFQDAAMPPGLPPTAEGWKALVKAVHAAFPDVTPKILQLWEGDGFVVMRSQATGTMKGALLGIPAHGHPVTWNECHVWTFRDGLIIGHDSVADIVGAVVTAPQRV